MSTDGQRIKGRRNIAENFNRLSRVHERYMTDRRQTDARRYIVSSRSLKIVNAVLAHVRFNVKQSA